MRPGRLRPGAKESSMVDSISAGSASVGIYPSAAAATASAAAATSPTAPIVIMTPGHQTPVTPADAGLGDLNANDWKLVSAAVGKDIGPTPTETSSLYSPSLLSRLRMSGAQAPSRQANSSLAEISRAWPTDRRPRAFSARSTTRCPTLRRKRKRPWEAHPDAKSTLRPSGSSFKFVEWGRYPAWRASARRDRSRW